MHELQPILESVRFEFLSGDVTRLERPFTTQWRTLPALLCTQLMGGSADILLKDGTVVRYKHGEMALVPAGIPHKIDLLTPSAVSRWVHVNFFVFGALDLFSLLDVPPVAAPRQAEKTGELIENWIVWRSRSKSPSQLETVAHRNVFGFQLLEHLLEFCPLKRDGFAHLEGAQRIGRAVEHIHEHFDTKLNRDRLAKLACLSPAQFHRLFRVTMGTSPVGYLKQIRLRHAQQLLMTTDLPVAEIARKVGYEDCFTFSKFFKRDAGAAPRDYRTHIRQYGV